MKDLVGKKFKETQVPIQQLYGLYAMEQLIVKLSKDEIADHLIVKGGFLLATHLGVQNRVTRDLDFTVQGFYLNEDTLRDFIDVIEQRDEKDQSYFECKAIKITRENFDYEGYNLRLDYINDKTKIPIHIDLTSGEKLVSIHYQKPFQSIFTDETYQMSSYEIEQVLVDKLYTLLAYGSIDDTNSRMKDYYDLYLLTKVQSNLNFHKVNKGLQKMMQQRNLVVPNEQYQPIIESLMASPKQNQMWAQYCSKNIYAADLPFDEVMTQVRMFAQDLIKQQQLAYTKKQNDLEI